MRMDIEQNRIEVNGSRRTVINSFTISDNGSGMDEAGIDNALCMGSDTNYYSEGTLSKFGLGLKSASSSLGKCLTVITKGSDGICRTAVLDHDVIEEAGDYVYELDNSSSSDVALFEERVGDDGQTGTIIKVSKIHHDRMPSVPDIIGDITRKAG